MKPILYAHPFSSYSQKALIALYEYGTPFEYRSLEDKANYAELAALWPLKKFPVLVDAGRTLLESSTIIEYLTLHYAGSHKLVPADADAALEVRTLDRVFDNYVMTPMQAVVFDCMKPPERRDPVGVTEAKTNLEAIYAWLEGKLAQREWIAGDAFSMADCSAAPSLFYADWVLQIDAATYPQLHRYRKQLLARPSFARCVDEGRPFRHYFPPGAPDRD